jgi:lipid-binding SYLF domain-containing protein
MKRGILRIAAASAMALAFVPPASADETSRLTDAAKVVEQIKPEISDDIWNNAKCVGVIPNLKKAAFIVGGEYGKGVVSCRSAEGWSAPLHLQLAKGSWGFQAGAEQVDLVLLVMNESGVDKLLKNKIELGADASVAAGPMGRRGAVGTDVALNAEILSYAQSKGLFAGIDLSGGVLKPDDDANHAMYGRNATPRTILASREISAPPAATPFLRALGSGRTASASSPSSSPAKSTSAEARSTPRSTTDDDVRQRLVDAQQTIDRILSDTTSSTVGTSGSTTGDKSRSGMITIERARLLQLRQQIDAALAQLNKR